MVSILCRIMTIIIFCEFNHFTGIHASFAFRIRQKLYPSPTAKVFLSGEVPAAMM